ncbi:hypothetical protein Bca52824_072983 [Brassica carinata]|uniref:Uncharacterized protein n=1 Tax=Brassica carinata TaxID=52824 RepID=A0A8X7U5F0_BRACI|nr:hypothetical protein Bca52824_072983 [Brassica carinata]
MISAIKKQTVTRVKNDELRSSQRETSSNSLKWHETCVCVRSLSTPVKSWQSSSNLGIRHADSTIPSAHGSQQLRDDSIVTVRPWRYVHGDVYGDLFLAVSRSTLYPWLLAPVVQNTVFTDRSRNHPGVRSLIGIRSMSMTARPRRSVYDTSFMAT